MAAERIYSPPIYLRSAITRFPLSLSRVFAFSLTLSCAFPGPLSSRDSGSSYFLYLTDESMTMTDDSYATRTHTLVCARADHKTGKFRNGTLIRCISFSRPTKRVGERPDEGHAARAPFPLRLPRMIAGSKIERKGSKGRGRTGEKRSGVEYRIIIRHAILYARVISFISRSSREIAYGAVRS